MRVNALDLSVRPVTPVANCATGAPGRPAGQRECYADMGRPDALLGNERPGRQPASSGLFSSSRWSENGPGATGVTLSISAVGP